MIRTVTRLAPTTLALALLVAPATRAGSLEPPPGGPASTMKTIAQAAPGTPIDSTVSFPYWITAPGSYYLTGDLVSTGADAIIIANAQGVTLDLRGFSVRGGASFTGIGVFDSCGVRIFGGHVKNFAYGVIIRNVVGATTEDLDVRGASIDGLRYEIGSTGAVRRTAVGGTTGAGAVFIDNVRAQAVDLDVVSTGGPGVVVMTGTQVSFARLRVDGAATDGLFIQNSEASVRDSTISHVGWVGVSCVASQVDVSDTVIRAAGIDGILAQGAGRLIATHNRILSPLLAGISVKDGPAVIVSDNEIIGAGNAGIRTDFFTAAVTGIISDNRVLGCDSGILVSSSLPGITVARNLVTESTGVDYGLSSGQNAPITSVTSSPAAWDNVR